jgi:hypothetical protein
MPTAVHWIEFNGSAAGSGQGSKVLNPTNLSGDPKGTQGNLNFGNTDAPSLNPASYPIAAGANSYAKFIKLQFSGNFSQISNPKLWLSSGALVTGQSIKFSGNYTKITPSTTALPAVGAHSVPDIPTTQPVTNNVCLPNTTISTLPYAGQTTSSPGYYSGSRSSMMAFQEQTTSAISAGATNALVFSVTYDRM